MKGLRGAYGGPDGYKKARFYVIVNIPTPDARYSVFSTEPADMVGDVLHPGGLTFTPQVRLGVDENTGAATGAGLLPKTEGTVEARVNVRESRRLRGTLSWQYAYGCGSGFHYNTIVASAKYLW